MGSIQIYLSISQIAILIGESPYGSLSDIILNLWPKVDNERYQKTLKKIEKKYKTSLKTLTEWERLNILANELGLNNIIEKTQQSMKKTTHDSLLEDQNSIITEINNLEIPDIDKTELENKKAVLIKMVSGFSNRGFGSHNENNAIEIYTNTTKFKISEKQKVVIGRIKRITNASTNKTIEWFIKGKIDGIATDKKGHSRLIEVKNRTKTLFGCLKEYEKPQIQTYLKLLNLDKAHMVENLSNQINILDIDFEEDYWKFILKRLLSFITFFYNFLENNQLQEALLLKNLTSNLTNETVEQDLRQLLSTYFV
jgi:hypothetical protein